jgi:hypothetical protein
MFSSPGLAREVMTLPKLSMTGCRMYNTTNFADIFTVTNTVGTTTNYLDTSAATNVPARFYRVRLVP